MCAFISLEADLLFHDAYLLEQARRRVHAECFVLCGTEGSCTCAFENLLYLQL